MDAAGNVIAEVDPQFVTQVLEALPEGSHVPGGMEDMLPENYGEPSAEEQRYHGDFDKDPMENEDDGDWSTEEYPMGR